MRNSIIIILFRLFLRVLYVFPVKSNKICLLCFDGTKLGYDAKAIVEYIYKKKLAYDIVWLTKDNKTKKEFVLYNTRFEKYKSIRGVFELMTSGTIIYNITAPPQIPYRKNQLLINTWHGFGIKLVGKYIENYSKYTMSLSSCMLSHAKRYTEWIIRDSFEFEGDVINSGVPRNDVFFSDRITNKKSLICEQYSIVEKNIVLYAPTFRGDFESSKISINFSLLLNSLNKRFGGEWVVLYRNHPLAKGSVEFNETVIDVSEYPDMQDLLCASDVLITDYSSSCWDFSLLKRPIFIFADDIEHYERKSVFMSLTDLPYPIAQNNQELMKIIGSFSEQKYMEDLRIFHQLMGNYENGTACEKLFGYIETRHFKK